MLYKPELAKRTLKFLNENIGGIHEHDICCRHEPGLPKDTKVINICAGCDRRFRELYEGVSTVSLWEVLSQSAAFTFPDYHGKKMSILDACPTRTEERVHGAIRTLLERMNITLVEPEKTRTKGTCCGDSFYGAIPVSRVKEQMKKRADEMPCEDVVVYCVSCIKSLHIGGKKPRYIVDLLYGEDTDAGTYEPDEWHGQLQQYIDAH
jgi:Fe-S oxidoreductase